MYIIQELIDDATEKYWFDRYQTSDYEVALQFLDNFSEKYKGNKFRLIEVFIYV